jgi:16S rRNA (guanine527-N7)-methyltransferase
MTRVEPDDNGAAERPGEDSAERPPPQRPPPKGANGDPAEEGAKGPARDDADAELQYAELPVPDRAALRAALDWAFSAEQVPAALLDLYARHAELVLAGNRRMNLTAIVDAREVAAKHYLDSWRATRLLPLMGRTVLDLGTGAGFPGLPIAMAEEHCTVACLDSTQKRAGFVAECIAELDVKNATSVAERGEEHLLRNRYDIVVLRAISSVRENVRMLRKVRHSLKDLVMLKGPSWSRETRAAEREAERLGFSLDTVWDHELPGGLGERAILVYRAPGGMGE